MVGPGSALFSDSDKYFCLGRAVVQTVVETVVETVVGGRGFTSFFVFAVVEPWFYRGRAVVGPGSGL